MKTFMPLTQATMPSKGAAPEPKKTVSEREGKDFDTVFKTNDAPADTESQTQPEDVVPADLSESETEPDNDSATHQPDMAVIEVPLKNIPGDAEKMLFSEEHIAISDRQDRPARIAEMMQKDGANQARRQEPKPMQANAAAPDKATGEVLAMTASTDELGEAEVGARIETGLRQTQQPPITHIFGLQLDRGTKIERMPTGVASLQPESIHSARLNLAQMTTAQTDQVDVGITENVEKSTRLMDFAPQADTAREPRAQTRAVEHRELPGVSMQDKAPPAARPEAQIQAPRLTPAAQMPEPTPFLSEEVATTSFDASVEMPVEGRLSTSPARFDPMINVSRPEMARHIGTQLADALPRAADRPVELSLNPEELGKVRISLNAVDSGITMSVTAERPETIDLMRRHIDQLAQEFRALGYGSISFDFNQQSGTGDFAGGGSDGSSTEAGPSGESADVATDLGRTAGLRVASEGLDIRL